MRTEREKWGVEEDRVDRQKERGRAKRLNPHLFNLNSLTYCYLVNMHQKQINSITVYSEGYTNKTAHNIILVGLCKNSSPKHKGLGTLATHHQYITKWRRGGQFSLKIIAQYKFALIIFMTI